MCERVISIELPTLSAHVPERNRLPQMQWRSFASRVVIDYRGLDKREFGGTWSLVLGYKQVDMLLVNQWIFPDSVHI